MAFIRCLVQAGPYRVALVALVQDFSVYCYHLALDAEVTPTIHWKYAQGKFSYTKWNMKI